MYFKGEYGGWAEALQHGDLQATFVLAEPHKIPLHNFYEFIWLLKTGGPRMVKLNKPLPISKRVHNAWLLYFPFSCVS